MTQELPLFIEGRVPKLHHFFGYASGISSSAVYRMQFILQFLIGDVKHLYKLLLLYVSLNLGPCTQRARNSENIERRWGSKFII